MPLNVFNKTIYWIYSLNNLCLLSLRLQKKIFNYCHFNVIHMRIIAFCVHFSTIACCPYLTCSSVCNYSLHSGLFLSVLNIIHVLDLESVCLIPKIYIIITLDMFCILLCFYLWIYGTLNKMSYHISLTF